MPWTDAGAEHVSSRPLLGRDSPEQRRTESGGTGTHFYARPLHSAGTNCVVGSGRPRPSSWSRALRMFSRHAAGLLLICITHTVSISYRASLLILADTYADPLARHARGRVISQLWLRL